MQIVFGARKRSRFAWVGPLLGGVGAGALAAYFLDPDQGARRRALAADAATRSWKQSQRFLSKAGRDLGNRAAGLVAETRSLGKGEQFVEDDLLVARVRSAMGHVVSHPHAVQVHAENGHVVLSGPILASEADSLLAATASVKGVQQVDNALELHETAASIPALQGESPSGRQGAWSPGIRLAAGAAGGAMGIYGLQRRDTAGYLMAGAGAALAARAALNVPLPQLVPQLIGLPSGAKLIEVRKSINIRAGVDQVFGFWSRFDNFPQFMDHVLEVTHTGPATSHWKVRGPGGIPTEWDAELTAVEPNSYLEWRTVGNGPVEHSGAVRFLSNPDGTTTVEVQMLYLPAAGAVGHAVASLLGADPKHAMDEDLLRFKSLIEQGSASAHGRKVPAGEVSQAGRT